MGSVPELSTRYAALVAITDAVAAEKNRTSAELQAAAKAAAMTKGTIATPLGPITLRENKGSTAVVVDDEDALVGWCEQNHAEALETITRVRQADRAAILNGRFTAVAGKVVDSVTGEVVPFARVVKTNPAPPTPSYGASEQQREVKRLAAALAAERTQELAEGLQRRAIEALVPDPPEYDPMDGE